MQLLLDMQQIYGANDILGFWLISLAESMYKIVLVLKVMIDCFKKMMVIIIDSFQMLFFMVGRSWLKGDRNMTLFHTSPIYRHNSNGIQEL